MHMCVESYLANKQFVTYLENAVKHVVVKFFFYIHMILRVFGKICSSTVIENISGRPRIYKSMYM